LALPLLLDEEELYFLPVMLSLGFFNGETGAETVAFLGLEVNPPPSASNINTPPGNF
jgi:hypothetical protein